jgi:hypothetical protein
MKMRCYFMSGSYLYRTCICTVVLLTVNFAACSTTESISESTGTYYVDPVNGNDANSGLIAAPFQSLDHALQVVSDHVDAGIRSDKIYLRGGVYKKQSAQTLYRLHLKGTPDDYALLSAMPADPNAQGAVQQKSGKWYERVVFDDAWVVETPWEKHPTLTNVWTTNPGYTQLEWTHQNLWPWTKFGFPITDKDDTPTTTSFTVAPYMLLQDGEPTLWVETPNKINVPGVRYYDQDAGVLYYRPIGDADPNTCKIETWNGGPEDFHSGTLHLDGEGRALFTGNMEYAGIVGIEFRMFNKLFEFNRRGYPSQAERIKQRYILFEDNLCQYGWMQILLDATTVFSEDTGQNYPRYDDRCNWVVRNNVFFRPGREICQLHGDDHLFEFNEVIDHGGPWAGPAACVSVINTRNTRNFRIRHNYISGQGNTPYIGGSVFMIETGSSHADENGDYLFGGQTYEYNIIANITQGAAFVLGKGGVRLRNVTIRNNVIAGNQHTEAIRISNPHKNLIIEHNVFYNQRKVIAVQKPMRGMAFEDMSSTMQIRNNIFMNNDRIIDARLLSPPGGSEIVIDNNLFHQNAEPAVGTNIREGDPRFNDPEAYDFRVGDNSSAINDGDDIGVFSLDASVMPEMQWWNIRRGKWASQGVPAGKYYSGAR